MKNFLGNNLVRWRYLLISVFLGVVLCFQIIVSATDSPDLVVNQFYRWYIQNNSRSSARISEQETAFTPELYRLLAQVFQRRQGIDFDPFCDCQVGTFRMAVQSVRQYPDDNLLTEVNINVYSGLRPPGSPRSIKVLVTQDGDRWRIQNLIYSVRRGDNDLLSILREITN